MSQSNMDIKEFVRLLIKNDLAMSDELQGCSEKEIEELENHIGASLPKSYREFLAVMGHNAGIYQAGTDYLYKNIIGLTDRTREVSADGPFQLPKDAFVFSSHQGYIFNYFRLSEGDDPPVYSYMETEPSSKRLEESFSEFLVKSLEAEISVLSQLKDREKYIQYLRHGRSKMDK